MNYHQQQGIPAPDPSISNLGSLYHHMRSMRLISQALLLEDTGRLCFYLRSSRQSSQSLPLVLTQVTPKGKNYNTKLPTYVRSDEVLVKPLFLRASLYPHQPFTS